MSKLIPWTQKLAQDVNIFLETFVFVTNCKRKNIGILSVFKIRQWLIFVLSLWILNVDINEDLKLVKRFSPSIFLLGNLIDDSVSFVAFQRIIIFRFNCNEQCDILFELSYFLRNVLNHYSLSYLRWFPNELKLLVRVNVFILIFFVLFVFHS